MLNSMNIIVKISISSLLLLGFAVNLQAEQVTDSNTNQLVKGSIEGIEIIGEKVISIPIRKSNQAVIKGSVDLSALTTKKIKLLDIKISSELKQELTEKAAEIQKERDSDVGTSSSVAVDLGMNSVPVFDQGIHGTCITFANTALIDALKSSGDYISQQCLLELGVYQEKNTNIKSGWDGFDTSTIVLDRIKNFGVIDKKNCPHTYGVSSHEYEMDEATYVTYSNKLWVDSFTWKNLETGNIEQVKEALNKGHRISTAVLLKADAILGEGINGNWSGLWQLPKDVDDYMVAINSGNSVAHAVVIIGYDDEKQLIKVRNSWSTSTGEQGNYYMTYEFYKLLNIESIEVY